MRIVSEGLLTNSNVLVDGEPLVGVVACSWSIDGKGYATAHLTVDMVGIDADLPASFVQWAEKAPD
jgi:hypothetical protein